MIDFEIQDSGDGTPYCDMCRCSNCGWEGEVSECEAGIEHIGQSELYTAHLCPVCEDGGRIDDYWSSREDL